MNRNFAWSEEENRYGVQEWKRAAGNHFKPVWTWCCTQQKYFTSTDMYYADYVFPGPGPIDYGADFYEVTTKKTIYRMTLTAGTILMKSPKVRSTKVFFQLNFSQGWSWEADVTFETFPREGRFIKMMYSAGWDEMHSLHCVTLFEHNKCPCRFLQFQQRKKNTTK